ncbi:MAG: hypothetical protein IPM97_07895 [Bdellovibrionaceae bacterium]|nr:hypothetical protein [Pseudobdellovibrionaceae bacterium]
MGNLLLLISKVFLFKKAAVEVKKRGFLLYLKALQVARKSLAGALLVYTMLQFLVIGFFGAVTAAIFLLPHDLETKLFLIFFICLGVFIVTLIGFLYAMSEKVWYKAAQVEEILEQFD